MSPHPAASSLQAPLDRRIPHPDQAAVRHHDCFFITGDRPRIVMQVAGTVRVPGDKSISHRVLLLAAMARGTTHINGLLTSLDTRSSARVLRQLGATVSPLAPDRIVRIVGRGRLHRPSAPLHCGNSGTTTRLLFGLLAAHPFPATLTGDRSLRRRPMRRVTDPLAEMGARFQEHAAAGLLPITVRGGPLEGLTHRMPVSSAQIKSAILCAGLAGKVPVSIFEPRGRSRDHTERLLRAFGYQVEADGGWVHFQPTGRVVPFELQVPGDPSSAAFPVGAAVLAEGGEIRITGVCLNPTRTGFLRVLERMGARVHSEAVESQHGEPVGDLIAAPSALRATEVTAPEIPGLIDEIPMLAALATRAEGTTAFRQVGELRVKESDRLGLIARNIRALGGNAEVIADDLVVEGGTRPPVGLVRTEGDHRIAMAFAVLGAVRGARVGVDDLGCSAVSYPGFPDLLRRMRRGSR